LDRQMSLAFYALTVVLVQSFQQEVTLMYFAAGSIRTKAHGYLYDSWSLPHRKGKLTKRSCRIQIMNKLSPKPREAANAGCGGHAPPMTRNWMQGFHF
jgi:hypothetical protein